MAASMYIVVEGEDPGYDIFVNGRALARNEDALERMAIRLGVRPLIDFFSADENSMSLLIEEGAGDMNLLQKLPPPQWFDGEQGLATVRPMLNSLRDEPQQLGSDGETAAGRAGGVRGGSAKDGRPRAALAPSCKLAVAGFVARHPPSTPAQEPCLDPCTP